MAQRKAHAWLAAQGVDLASDKRRTFCAFFDDLPADAPHREEVLASAVLFLQGELTPAIVGERLAKDRAEVDTAFACARAVGRLAVAGGEPEARVADALGVDRMTLRKWQGKR